MIVNQLGSLSMNIITISIRQLPGAEMCQITMDRDQGIEGYGKLPWVDDLEWKSVFNSLKLFSNGKEKVPSGNIRQMAIKKNLCSEEGRVLPERIEILGRELYENIFNDEKLERDFQEKLSYLSPIVILHFLEGGSYLQTYPWEIMHDGTKFVFKSHASLVRHIDFRREKTPIKLQNKLSVYLADPRPNLPDYDNIESQDRVILKSFSDRVDFFDIHSLDNGCTFRQYLNLISQPENQQKIIHIDSHGDFGTHCAICDRLYHNEKCPNCQESSISQMQGHLAFEMESNVGWEWISADDIADSISAQGDIALAVIAACSSGLTGDRTAFNSVAGALIERGIPAVVGMQFPVEHRSTTEFVETFYQRLIKKEPLAQAVKIARTTIRANSEVWYRPVLYLRTDPNNIVGHILYTTEDWFSECKKSVDIGLGELLNERNFTVADENNKEIILGKVPRISDLSKNKYMERTHLVNEFIELISRTEVELTESTLRIFWISGRSGSGKSVLLLQILRQLFKQQNTAVIWLKRDSKALTNLLRFWKESPPPPDVKWYIAVDDLNSPGRLDQNDVNAISDIVGEAAGIQFPIILTCSPTKHRQTFEKVIDKDLLRVISWEIPLVTEMEGREIRNWFQQLTGKIPQARGTAFDQGNEGLILSMFVEMDKGEISRYSNEFAQRVKSEGEIVESAMISLLALNRLYIYPHRDWLDDKQRIALENFDAQGDITFQGEDDDFVRLTHPHLSDGFYNALQEAHPEMKANDILMWFNKFLGDNRLDSLSDLLKSLVDHSDRIEEDSVKHFIKEASIVWNEKHTHISHHRDGLIVWQGWMYLASQRSEILKQLDHHPADYIFSVLKNDYGYQTWWFHWLSVLDVLDTKLEITRRKKYVNVGTDWIRNHNRLAWNRVFEYLLEVPEAIDNNDIANSLVSNGIIWLKNNVNKTYWSRVWEKLPVYICQLVDKPDDVYQVIELGMKRLESPKYRSDYPFIWQCLMLFTQCIREILIDNNETDVNKETLQRYTNQLPGNILSWLRTQQNNIAWPFVYEAAIRYKKFWGDSYPKDLGIIGHEFITNNRDKKGWKFVVEDFLEHIDELIDDHEQKLEIISLGMKWIYDEDEKLTNGWAPVYSSLTIAVKGSIYIDQTQWKRLINLGTDWLLDLRNREKYEWSYICPIILDEAKTGNFRHHNNDALHSIIQSTVLWLTSERNELYRGWSRVYLALASVSESNEKIDQGQLLHIGLAWLTTYANNQSSENMGFILQHLYLLLRYLDSESFSDEKLSFLLTLTKEWIQNKNNEQLDQWNYVFQSAIKYNGYKFFETNEEFSIYEIGVRWLHDNAHLNTEIWPFMFSTLIKYTLDEIDRNSLVNFGHQWIKKHTNAKHFQIREIMFAIGIDYFNIAEGDEFEVEVRNKDDADRNGIYVYYGSYPMYLHVKHIEWKRTPTPMSVLSVGDKFQVRVIKIDDDSKSIRVSRRILNDKVWEGFLKKYTVGDIVNAKIDHIPTGIDGVFLSIDMSPITGRLLQGLLHRTEMLSKGDGRLDQYFQVGDPIKVRIIKIDPIQHTIGFSVDKLPDDVWQAYLAELGEI